MFKNEEGFSLLELVVAVGVAGIIAAVALPTFAGLQDKATTTSATYAASASAAEALANSTIGGVNNTTSNNSSYTGGSSSSYMGGMSSSSSNANIPVGLVTYTAGVDYTAGTFYGTAGSGSGMWAISGSSSTLAAVLTSNSSWTITLSKSGFSGSYEGNQSGSTKVWPWPLSSEFPNFTYDLNSIQINATTGEVFIQIQ